MFYYFLCDNHLILVEVKQLGPHGHTNTQTKNRQSYSAELMSNPIFLGDFTFTGKDLMR